MGVQDTAKVFVGLLVLNPQDGEAHTDVSLHLHSVADA